MSTRGVTTDLLMRWYDAMRDALGPRNWWPADTPFEVCVGAILTQNTTWKNTSKAIAQLAAAGALDPFVIYRTPLPALAELIRPAGYFNIKAKRLHNFIAHLVERHDGALDSLFAASIDDLRAELLSINGIGFETADSIILYAAQKPIFVVDAYTVRVLRRHDLLTEEADYLEVQSMFHDHLESDVELYNDFHAQFVEVGAQYCRRKPRCDECPLAVFRGGEED
jgi:endonuclease-3 related protein